MKKLFLDTSAYSAFKKGLKSVVEAIEEADQVYLNAIVVGELLAGFEGGRFREINRRELKDFLSSPVVFVPSMSEETAERYSLIYQSLKKQGTPIPTNDMWIASTVMEIGSALLTTDHHFLHVPQIQTVFIAST